MRQVIHMNEHCNSLQHTATHCNTLQHTATHCNTLQHIATHCNTLQHTATHYNSLQHTATHCNTLQHNATYCNTLRCGPCHSERIKEKKPFKVTDTPAKTSTHTHTHTPAKRNTSVARTLLSPPSTTPATRCNTLQHGPVVRSLVSPRSASAESGKTAKKQLWHAAEGGGGGGRGGKTQKAAGSPILDFPSI